MIADNAKKNSQAQILSGFLPVPAPGAVRLSEPPTECIGQMLGPQEGPAIRAATFRTPLGLPGSFYSLFFHEDLASPPVFFRCSY